MSSKSKVCFFFEQRRLALENRTRLKAFIEFIFRKERKGLSSLNCIFCSDKRLRLINQQFLKHNYYTDIIAFDISGADSIQAEIYISVDRVKDNARQFEVSFKSELHRVIFHGVLHLCGYEDKSKGEKKEMKEKENFYLNIYFK